MRVLETRPGTAATDEVWPQVQHMGPGYRWDAPDSLTRIEENRPLGVAPNLRSFHLKPEAQLTDLVSQNYVYAIGLLASERFCRALEGFVVQAHESYPAEVVHLDRTHPYRYLHVVEELEGRIDYAASRFVVRGREGDGEPVEPSGPDELRRLCRELVERRPDARVEVETVAFVPGTPPHDLFCLRLAPLTWFASDPLAAELTRRGLTGFVLRPTAARFTIG